MGSSSHLRRFECTMIRNSLGVPEFTFRLKENDALEQDSDSDDNESSFVTSLPAINLDIEDTEIDFMDKS
jgi:hypothetical protein